MITVNKRNEHGKLVWQYIGDVLERSATHVQLEAVFGRNNIDIGVLTFREGDKMIEWFYTDRWYNVFEVHDGNSDTIKGWYCNITRPALISETEVSADDLAVDVVVTRTGDIHILDEDDFNALDISAEDRQAALSAIDQLRAVIDARGEMFAVLGEGA